MARFKFGKKKKETGTESESITSGDNTKGSIDAMPIKRGDSIKDTAGVYSTAAHGQPAPSIHSQIPADISTTSHPSEAETRAKNITASTPWKRFKLFNSPFPRYRHAAATITSEKNEIFLMGGLKEGSVFGDTWKIIPDENHGDIVGYTSKSVDVANLNHPPARVGHSAVLCGNAFIVYGGDTVDTDFNGFPDNNFYLFNINNSKYTIPSHILNKPNGRYGHTIGVVSLNNTSSRLYLFGGQLENDVFSDLYYFELNTFKSPKARWELVEPLNNFKPPPLTNHSMSVYKNKIYIFGGVYNNEKVSNDLWSFDALVNKWSQIPTSGAVPLPVNEHSAVIVNDKLYVYGGNDFSGIIYNSLHVLDLRTFVWSKMPEDAADPANALGPGPRCGHSMTYLPKYHKLVIMGGDKNDYIVEDPANFDTYEEYNGEEFGTMIYELDVDLLDHFVTDKVPEKASVHATPKKMAASAAAVSTSPDVSRPDGPSSALRQSYERHARSFSAGPEDFRTPDASPERVKRLNGEKAEVNLGDEIPPLNPYREEPRRKAPEAFAGEVAREVSVPRDVEPQELVEPQEPQEPQELVEGRANGKSNGVSEDVKKIISELTNELDELKASTKLQMQNATERIHNLEQDNAALVQSHQHDSENYEKRLQEKDLLIQELKSTIDPSLLNVESTATESSGNISELSKYKLDRLELTNKLLYLEQENLRLTEKQERFEPFMNNQIGGLTKFQKIIKVQEEKIHKLSQQVKDELVLHKQINEWKAKHDNLQMEFDQYKTIYYDDPVSDDEDIEVEDPQGTRSIMSGATRRSKRDISSHLENLVSAWNVKAATDPSREVADEESGNTNNAFVQKLQGQINDLLRVSKQNEEKSQEEIARVRDELAEKLNSLRMFEENYRDAIQSVNNTSKALKMNEEEIRNQKLLVEKLTKENNELNLYVKAAKRHSSKQPLPLAQGQPLNSHAIPEEDEHDADLDESSAINNAHFNMKIQDLEANLYILSQERDQLKDTVTSLQKQLYFKGNN